MADTNKVRFGLSNVHYALLTYGENGAVTFGTPTRIPGGVNLTLSPEGDMSPFYADNMVYYMAGINAGYTGNLEIAKIPDSFKTDVLNYVTDSAGALVETTNAEYKPFALLFQIEGDKNARKHVLYNCMANRPQITAATTGSAKNPQTETIPLTCGSIPNTVLDTEIVKASAVTGDSAYSGWFTTVHVPAAASNG
jgi:phi13 family phage major tail protein